MGSVVAPTVAEDGAGTPRDGGKARTAAGRSLRVARGSGGHREGIKIRTAAGRSPATLCVALALAGGLAAPAAGQDPPPPDTTEVVADSVAALPDSLGEVFSDTLPPPPPPRTQQFPARLTELRGASNEVFECDRECVHASPAFSLLELLIDKVPGLTPVRGDFFAGPHYALDGVLGPGFVDLYVDGRLVSSLEGPTADLRRLSLNYIDRVRVYRGAGGMAIDVELIRHDASSAYSRIGGSTGYPRVEILDGVFANGLGRSFNVEGSFELHDINDRQVNDNRFAARGRLSWIPGSKDFGVQFGYRTENIRRDGVDTLDANRRELILRSRAKIGEQAQLEAYGYMTNFRRNIENLPDSVPRPEHGANGLGVRFSGRPGRGAVSLDILLSGGAAYPSRRAEATAWQPVGPVAVEAGAELAGWKDFNTASYRGGLAYLDTLLFFPIAVRTFGAKGMRGIGFPSMAAAADMSDGGDDGEMAPVPAAADSIGFHGLGASATLGAGPFTLSGRYSKQWLSRTSGFGAGFDRLVAASTDEVDFKSWEARLDGPLLPFGLLLKGVAPLRLNAYWREFESVGPLPLFIPERQLRAEVYFHDTAFNGNLELWLSVRLQRREARMAPAPGSRDLVTLETDSWLGGHFMFKIGDFRFFWRLDNLKQADIGDFPEALFPIQINVFGLRWEFFN